MDTQKHDLGVQFPLMQFTVPGLEPTAFWVWQLSPNN